MLCKSCESTSGDARSAQADRSSRPSGGESDRVRDLLCARCGAVVPPWDPSDAMLDKLSQLARFGLGEGVGPLLDSTRGRTIG